MAGIDLIFNRAFTTGNPVELVFGDDGGGGQVPDATLAVAARMPDQVDEEVRRRRADIIMEAQTNVMAAKQAAKVGQTLECICDGIDDEVRIRRVEGTTS